MHIKCNTNHYAQFKSFVLALANQAQACPLGRANFLSFRLFEQTVRAEVNFGGKREEGKGRREGQKSERLNLCYRLTFSTLDIR